VPLAPNQRRRFLASLLLLIPPGPLCAQTRLEPSTASIAVRLASIPAVTGYEQAMVDTLLRLLPGATRDRAGNAVLTLGQGKVRRLVICPLDEPGYVVGNVRDDGYLTLRRVPGKVGPLFDQQLEGHRVTIQARRGPVPGVVGVRSIHLTRGRSGPGEAPFTVDDAVVDVGAATQAEVARLGISVLAPVTLTKHPHAYGDNLLAAPVSGRRAACAALVGAALRAPRKPRLSQTIVAFAVEQQLAERGLATLANMLGPFDETLLVDGRPGARGALQQGPDSEISARWEKLGTTHRWSLPVSYDETVVETVSMSDVESLETALVGWIGGRP
jgi:putative aminopeptidase FrvX